MPVVIGVLQQPDAVLQKIIDFKEVRGEQYHPSSFVISQEVEEGVLMYQTLTCELILVRKNTILANDKYLREHLFFVPESMDEKQLVREYRNFRRMAETGEKKISTYTILPTTDCNARCFYCYEMGRSRIQMTDETAMKVVGLIERNYEESRGQVPGSSVDPGTCPHDSVKLSWFGGEPLYNSRIIDIICIELEKRNIPYKSSMISNGYLFDEEMVRKAAELWKLKNIQITLDGTEEVYNRSKAFIYKDASPYQRVIRNIGMLLDAEIKVSVRLNIGLHNADDLFVLVRSLAEKFSEKKGFECYAHALFETSAGNNSVKHTDENRRLVYDKLEELEDLMRDLGIKSKETELPKEIKLHNCMADNGKSVVITPTGGIGLCEHYTEDNYIAQIDRADEVDLKVVEKFREVREEIELCDHCPAYPQCIRLKMCEESELCHPEDVRNQVNKAKRAMVVMYEKWKVNHRL